MLRGVSERSPDALPPHEATHPAGTQGKRGPKNESRVDDRMRTGVGGDGSVQ